MFWKFAAKTDTVANMRAHDVHTAGLVMLAHHLPQMKSLCIVSMHPYSLPSDMIQFLSLGSTFSCLLSLELRSFSTDLFFLNEIVRSRCLPKRHPDSTMPEAIAYPLDRFTVHFSLGESVRMSEQNQERLNNYFCSELELDKNGCSRYTFVGDNVIE